MPGAIALLKKDHRKIRKQFEKFKELSADATEQKRKVVQRMTELLTQHTFIENEVLYPKVEEAAPDLKDEILESYEEHHVADVLLAEISALKPDDERFDAKVQVLIENVDHHIDEEEAGWFPKVKEKLSRTDLAAIGEEMAEKRKKAPKNPQRKSRIRRAAGVLLKNQ